MTDVHPRDAGHGPVRWTERLIMGIPDRGAALFGRMIGLYDYVNGFHTDIGRLADMHARSNRFRELNIWIDNAPKKVRNAYSRICGDFPGMGRDAVLDPNLDIGEVGGWRDYEFAGLDSSQALDGLLKRFWDGDFVQMGLDLHMPIKGMNLIRRWDEIPSCEGRSIIRESSLKGTDRESAIRAWEEQESRVLALPGTKRKEGNL